MAGPAGSAWGIPRPLMGKAAEAPEEAVPGAEVEVAPGLLGGGVDGEGSGSEAARVLGPKFNHC
jgi:hypothetical protein